MNLLEQFIHWERTVPNDTFLRIPVGGKWRTWTYQEAGTEARRIAAGLLKLNLPARSHIAILSKNCPHWILSDLAILMSGYVSIPIYATLTAPSIQQILEHSETRVMIIGKLDTYDAQQAGIPASIIKIGIPFYGISEEQSWDDLLKNDPLDKVHSWAPDDIMTIIYTSGTTGKSKGVMHAIGTFETVSAVATKELRLTMRPKLFSYLPLSHIAERAGIEIIGIYCGAEISFAETLESFSQNLADTQPNTFFAVPRIWSKFREKILQKLPQKKLDTFLSIPLVGSLVKKSIRKKLGLSRATHIFSGAAPISVEMLKWYESLGVRILQAYGMTEDCLYAHFNRNEANRLGTVGQRFPGLQVKITEEGEVRLKSAGNLKGYFKEPQLTAEAFDEEGYLKTGDIGEIDKDGFLKLTGRLKDQFKTDKGKYISPAPIELKLLANPDVEMTCVVGMGIPQPIALIVLSVMGKAKSEDELRQSLSTSLAAINPTLEHFEKIEKAVVLKGEWTVENGLMTPSLKVKRNEVEKIHVPSYPQWYSRKDKIVWE